MATFSNTAWRMLARQTTDKPLPAGLDAAWHAGLGLADRLVRRQRRLLQRAANVLGFEKHFSDMTDARLREAADRLRETFRLHRETQDDLERAFALIREVATRQIGARPFLVQVAGAFALESGRIAEMATGEGKTLTATMPATIAGWRGRGCHVITVNDYLAQRDAEGMGRIYRFCGLRVAYVGQGMLPAERRAAYAADITYCTNKEAIADFLRDRIALGRRDGLSAALLDKMAGHLGNGRAVIDSLVQRGLHCAIIDEADSILIDEAVTPLIISGPAPNSEQMEAYQQAGAIAARLEQEADYQVNSQYREIALTDSGRERLSQLAAGWGGVWSGTRRSEEMITRALTAKELYRRDHHYVVDDGKIVIVDEFTGRLMPDRQWRDGLHQAVEVKEQTEVTPLKDTYGRISFQRFFRMYHKLAGMTGTGREATAEFWQIYHLPVVVIPTNRPCRRRCLPDIVFARESAKWTRIVDEIVRAHKTGRPVLVGTRSIRASEYLSSLLAARHLGHQVLNAVRHREEAQIIAGAGQPGRITVATNMAGRGTDIKLGRGVAELGGLHVIAAERNESARIDRQLFGRCARQGDPGSAQAIISLEDEFVSRYAGSFVACLQKRHGGREDDISSGLTRAAFRLAQARAERLALRRRRAVMKADHWLNEHLGFAGRE